MGGSTNNEFQFLGVNHLAPVCRDMKETVAFYNDLLGMPLDFELIRATSS